MNEPLSVTHVTANLGFLLDITERCSFRYPGLLLFTEHPQFLLQLCIPIRVFVLGR